MTSARSQHPDHALRENTEQRSHHGTHLAPDAAGDALFVGRGSGALGSNNGALSVRRGSALVKGAKYTLGSDAAIDIAGGDGDPRRDVVYLAPVDAMPDTEEQVTTGDGAAIGVREGTPGAFAHDSALDESERTITNAYRPAPPDFASQTGYPLTVVTVTANAGTLPTGALTELRAEAPTAAVAGNQTPGNKHVLDPDVTDFGAAVNDVMDAASDGDHLYIPPANYDGRTTAVIDTAHMTIYGDGVGTAYGYRTQPMIDQATDIPLLSIERPNVTVRGLNIYSGATNNDTSSGIEATGARTQIRDCYVRGFGKHGIHFHNPVNGSNNNAVVENTAVTHNDGDGVRISRAADAGPNNNAIRVSLSNATKNGGWAINVPEWSMGNHYEILNYTGQFGGDNINPNGGIRHAGIDSYAQIIYVEGPDAGEKVIKFDGPGGNVGEIHHTRHSANFGDLYEDTSSGPNYKWQYAFPGQPMFVGDEFRVGGTLRAADVLNQTPQSSPPSSPDADDIYVDDGTNTADGSRGFRQFDGSAWVDF